MPELQQETFQKRQIAYKVKISDILDKGFAKDEFSAGYIKLDKANVSRVNVIATVVYKSESSNYSTAIIDDGTGKILVRSFENFDKFSKIDVGDTILAIGKIREFNNERYIMPEIFKKINNVGWVNVRKLELENTKISDDVKIKDKRLIAEVSTNVNEEIYLLIKSLDKGDGVPIDDVISNSNDVEAENIINKLLENGDVFEIKPGRLKILE